MLDRIPCPEDDCDGGRYETPTGWQDHGREISISYKSYECGTCHGAGEMDTALCVDCDLEYGADHLTVVKGEYVCDDCLAERELAANIQPPGPRIDVVDWVMHRIEKG